jgi:methionyl-tRNA formyltransferase
MKILFCAYRDWAIKIYNNLRTPHSPDINIMLVQDPGSMELVSREQSWDVIIVVGWSWKVPADIVNSQLVIGMHPSDLPNYGGGSPIQNQILDGVEQTNATLFRLNEQFDKGEIIDKESIDLRGHLNEVLASIETATAQLILRFLQRFPNITYTCQTEKGKQVRRLKPKDSKLPNLWPNPLIDSTKEDGTGAKPMSCKQLWDFIRCREDPYPNAYFEDETGRLIIKHVEFEPKGPES